MGLTSGSAAMLLVLICFPLAFAQQRCLAHEECGISEYCDRNGACGDCIENCHFFQDSITGSCPCSRTECSTHNDCNKIDQFCEVSQVCYNCTVCATTSLPVDGICPSWCPGASTVPALQTRQPSTSAPKIRTCHYGKTIATDEDCACDSVRCNKCLLENNPDKQDLCFECRRSKYLFNGTCVNECPNGYDGGDSKKTIGRTCEMTTTTTLAPLTSTIYQFAVEGDFDTIKNDRVGLERQITRQLRLIVGDDAVILDIISGSIIFIVQMMPKSAELLRRNILNNDLGLIYMAPNDEAIPMTFVQDSFAELDDQTTTTTATATATDSNNNIGNTDTTEAPSSSPSAVPSTQPSTEKKSSSSNVTALAIVLAVVFIIMLIAVFILLKKISDLKKSGSSDINNNSMKGVETGHVNFVAQDHNERDFVVKPRNVSSLGNRPGRGERGSFVQLPPPSYSKALRSPSALELDALRAPPQEPQATLRLNKPSDNGTYMEVGRIAPRMNIAEDSGGQYMEVEITKPRDATEV